MARDNREEKKLFLKILLEILLFLNSLLFFHIYLKILYIYIYALKNKNIGETG